MLTEKELQILTLRKEGLLQIEIAKRLKMTQGAISRFEANAKRKIREAREELAMLDRLGIDIEDVEKIEQKLRKLQEVRK
jgi:transcriptional regulator